MPEIINNHLAILAILLPILFLVGIATGILKRMTKKEPAIVEKINNILPQTQCGQCDYPGCIPYAQAIANGDEINKCIPGGQETIEKIATLLNVDSIKLAQEENEETVAIIREEECIGCTLCIQACPVDAIIGSPKKMHTVISDYCTGCDLCLDPCPVDCIDMIALKDISDIENYTKEHTIITNKNPNK